MKKDPDYPLHLERAIKEKYGPETIVNPESLWTPEKEERYLEDLKVFYGAKNQESKKIEHSGVLISEKLLIKDNKMDCPVCFKYSPSFMDKVSHIKYECCYECYINYVEARESRWLTGWRPEKTKEVKKCL